MTNSNSLTSLAIKLILASEPNNLAIITTSSPTRGSSKRELRTFERLVAESDRLQSPVAMPLGLFRP